MDYTITDELRRRLQEAFDEVAYHLHHQGLPCTVPDPESGGGIACRYRDDEGRKCAIGALIPDAEYDDSIEGCVPIDVFDYVPSLWRRFGLTDQSPPCEFEVVGLFLKELQRAHDDAARAVDLTKGDKIGFGVAYRQRADTVARAWGLSPKVLAWFDYFGGPIAAAPELVDA